MRFRERAKKLQTSNLFGPGSGTNHIQIDLDPKLHGAIKQMLLATGEQFAGDAIRVILAGLAANDNQRVFALDERARVLITTFRDMLSLLSREVVENFSIESERQLIQFINQIHATEEDQ
jgi:hypothetical protein